jgi:hypothetical protein
MLLPERHYRARNRAAIINLVITVLILGMVGVVVYDVVSIKIAELEDTLFNITVEDNRNNVE